MCCWYECLGIWPTSGASSFHSAGVSKNFISDGEKFCLSKEDE